MPRAAKLSNGMTLKQMAFAKEWVMNGGVDTPAYRAAYDAEGMSDDSCARSARELRANPLIASCIEDMHRDILAASKITAEGIVARTIAIADYGMREEVKPQSRQEEEEGAEVQLRQVNPSAAVSALNLASDIMGIKAATKAKLDIGSIEDDRIQIALQDVRMRYTKLEKQRLYQLEFQEKMPILDAIELIDSERGDVIEGEFTED